MAGEIKQVIGFDTSGAIRAIDALDSRLKTFGGTLGTLTGQLNTMSTAAGRAFDFDAGKGVANMNKVANSASAAQKQVGAAFGTIGTDAQRAGAAIQKGLGPQAASNLANTGKAAKKSAEDASKGVKTLTVSFNTFARIVSTQVIIRAFSQIRQALQASVRDNINFQRSIREIGTILPVVERNADGLSQAVRGISDAFNLPIAQVSEGLYQAVSNQIGNAAESIKFLGTAAAFARVSVSSLNDSVNLLTAVINAFQLDATDAEVVAAQLFKTIELGRTRASEMANSLGRILPVMRALGVTTSETFAAISTLTIQGQKTSEALTQIRGAANALLKPTKETSAIIKELGFNSAEALVAARGLGGAFRSLKNETDGTLEAFAKVVPRVRGMNAALALAGSGAQKFESDLLKIEAAAQATLDQELRFIMDTNAGEVSSSLNQLANVFTVDLGSAINDTLATVLKFTGGIETLKTVFKTLVPIFALATLALTLYAASAAFAIIQTKLLAVTAAAAGGSIAAAFVVGTAGIAALVGIYLVARAAVNAYADGIAKARQELEQHHAAEIKSAERAAAAQRQLDDARLRRLNAQLQEQLAAFNRNHNAQIALAKKANDFIIADQDRVVKNVISASEKVLQATVTRAKKQRQLQSSAAGNARDFAADLSDVQFKNDNKRLEGLQRYSNLDRRANQLARQGRTLIGKATTEADAASARAVLDRADGYAAEASSLAEQLGHKAAINEAERLSEQLLRERIRGEVLLSNAAGVRADKLEQDARDQREALKKLKTLAEAVADAPSLFDDKGGALQGDALAKALEDRGDALSAFREAALASDAIELSDLINISKLSLDVGKELSEVKIQGLTVDSGAIQTLKRFIDVQFEGFTIQFGAEITSLEVLTGVKITDPGALSSAATRAVPEFRKINEQADKINIKQKEMAQLIHRVRVETELLGKVGTGADASRARAIITRKQANKVELTAAQKTILALDDTTAAAKRVVEAFATGVDPTAAFGDLDDTVKDMARLELASGGVPSGFKKSSDELVKLLGLITSVIALQNRIGILQEAGGSQTAAGSIQVQQQRADQFRRVLDRQHGAAADKQKKEAQAQAEITNQASNTSDALSGINQQLAFSVQATQQVADNLLRASRVSFAAQSSTPMTAATGGLAHFAKGGGPRGTDTIPAWLSPGEYVVDARNTRRFYSQLQSMTAGVQPVYRQEGGPVTNVGDINVHVASGQKGDAAGRTIARSIRRELRRNTSQL